MKKKILIGSIFAVLLMLSMPVISNIQAQAVAETIPAEETDECNICPENGECLGLRAIAKITLRLVDKWLKWEAICIMDSSGPLSTIPYVILGILVVPLVEILDLSMARNGIETIEELDDICNNWSMDDFKNIPDGF